MELLREKFQSDEKEVRPSISIGKLAEDLGTLSARLFPLVQNGYLRLVNMNARNISSDSLIEAPPPAAVLWMRGWFRPVEAKPLFSLDDVAGLLDLSVPDTLALAANYAIPVVWDEGLGWILSTWAARHLLMKVLCAREGTEVRRYDRQALLWMILEDDPKVALAPPSYSDAMERELERAAQLEEPMRSVRVGELLRAMHDAEVLAESARSSASPPTDPHASV